MAKATTILSLSLTLLFLFHASIAQLELQQEQLWGRLQSQQQHRLRAKTQCRIQQLTARGPSQTLKSEAGLTEFWDSNAEEFECAGVEFVRHVIQPGGLFLPYYANSPQLIYIVQGSGIQGTVIPGCAETYESESGSESRFSSRGREEGRRSDRHQKLRRFRQGDIMALQQGFTNWAYNDGDIPIITVTLIDVANDVNQLDLNFRAFFLAGKPESAAQGQERERILRRGEREVENSNIVSGFDDQLLAEIFNVDAELVRQLQAKEDTRGIIVRAEKPRLVLPEWGREEREEERGEREKGPFFNGVEETFCSMRMIQNIDHPSKADVYNPKGGRVTTLNSLKLPILNYLRLTAERGVLYRNAIRAPHWSTNAHTAMYVTRGSARIQVVGAHGNPVFDDEVRDGQLLIVPQNFVVLKKANEEGFEWVAFKTNDNAMNGQLAGRLSALRAMPDDVLVNSYGISREDAKSLKYGREESTLLSPGSRSGKYA